MLGMKKLGVGVLSGVLAIGSLFGGNWYATASENPTLSIQAQGPGTLSISTERGEVPVTDSQTDLSFEAGTAIDISALANPGSAIESLWIDGVPQSITTEAAEFRSSIVMPDYSTNIQAVFTEIQAHQDEASIEEIHPAEAPAADSESTEQEADLSADDEVVASLPQNDTEGNSNDEITHEPQEEAAPEVSDEVNDRLETAKKLGVADYVDADGYLTEDFWQTHDIRLLNLDDWSKLYASTDPIIIGGISSYSMRNRARSRDAYSVKVDQVVNFPNVAMPWGGYISNGYFSMSNGQTAFCGNGLLAPPQPTTPPTSEPTLSTNNAVRKALYYGYSGPDNRLTSFNMQQQVILTNEFLSYANTGKSIATEAGGGWHWTNGVASWYNNIQALPVPPSSFKVYRVEFADSSEPSWTGTYKSQPLFYGVIEPDKGSASLVKKSSVSQVEGDHYTLAGAEYGIYSSESDANSDNNRKGTLTTNSDGNSNTVSDLEVGTYYVKEVKAPAGYKLDSNVYSVSVTANQNAVITVQDDPMLGEILIHKVDGNNKPLKGAEFTLFNNNGTNIWFDKNKDGKAQDGEIIANGEIVTKVTSDGSGDCTIKYLSFGNYQLQETKIPDGFSGSKDKMDITVSQAVASVSIEITNKKIELKTEALTENGSHEQQATGEVILKDTVSYKNVNVGEEYVVKGVLINKATEEPLKDSTGNEITAETKFIPETADGTVVVEFKLDASQLAGISTVVFEDLFRTDGTLIASHRDINDQDQTINFIDIKTEASSENGSHDQQIGKVTIKDTVSYTGLTPGKEYTMSGKLMNKETGEVIKDKDGKEVVSEKKFIPETADGTVDVEFSFDASLLAGTQTVVFEDLISNGIVVAIHHDINDEDQSINFIDIKTTASSMNGSHEQQALGEVVLTDTISYSGLTPGKTYVVNGILMNKETGEPLLDKDGNQITGSTRFTAETADGTVDVEFKLDATDLAGKDIVVFEELLDKRTVIAEHKDIEDEDQTVSFIDIKTEALADNGSHVQINKQDVILKDTVTYTGLKPGQEYRLSGKLMNKETGEPMKDSDGKEISAETVFTPETPDGSVVVEFKFNAIDFENVETVVFEKLYRNDIEIAVHEDLTDEDQSVSFRSYSVLVNKVDSGTGRNITNSKFEFTSYEERDCKTAIRTVKGDEKAGTALFDKLAAGTTIYIKETKAPKGYLLSDEVVKVEVKDDGLYVNDEKVTDTGYLHSIVYKNTLNPVKKGGSAPTGARSGLMLFTALGTAAAAGIVVLMKRKKK